MLLNIVTLSRDVGGNDGSRRKLDTRRLALTRVGLLGTNDTDTKAHALKSRTVGVCQCGRNCVTRALALSHTAQNLVKGF